MDFAFSEKSLDVQARVRRFLDEHVVPRAREWEEQVHGGTFPPTFIEDLKARARAEGLWNMFLPGLRDDEPGTRLSNLDYAPVAEILGHLMWSSEVFNCNEPDTGTMELLHMFADERQYAEWLRPLMEGKIRSAFCMTEPAVASSDATNIQTRIERVGDHYVINGRKWFITNAADPRCKPGIVMGLTDPEAEVHRRQSMVIVPMDAPGLTIVRNPTVMNHVAPEGHCEVLFENVKVPVANLVGQENMGWTIAKSVLEHERLKLSRVPECHRRMTRVKALAATLTERGQPSAHIHVDDAARQHAELAHPPEAQHRHRGQAHQQVEHEEREHRDQPQREQVERAVAHDPAIDGAHLTGEARRDQVAEEIATRQERERRADAGRERDDDDAPAETEHRAREQRQQRRPGERQRGDRDVEADVRRAHRERTLGEERRELLVPGPDLGEREPAVEPEREERDDRQSHRREHGDPATRQASGPCRKREMKRRSMRSFQRPIDLPAYASGPQLAIARPSPRSSNASVQRRARNAASTGVRLPAATAARFAASAPAWRIACTPDFAMRRSTKLAQSPAANSAACDVERRSARTAIPPSGASATPSRRAASSSKDAGRGPVATTTRSDAIAGIPSKWARPSRAPS